MKKTSINHESRDWINEFWLWLYAEHGTKNVKEITGDIVGKFLEEKKITMSPDSPIMGRGEQLAVYNQNSEQPPAKFCQEITDFEVLVYGMRKAQKSFYASTDEVKRKGYLQESKEKEKQVDVELTKIGYGGQASLF